jgi:hypothetical protein
MDAFFVIPALVSPNVNARLVPAIAKTVERNIILNYSTSFRLALLRKYKNRTVVAEGPSLSADVSKEASKKGMELIAGAFSGKSKEIGANEKEILASKKDLATATTAIEYPKGLTFYHYIGLEPTYLQIPVTIKTGGLLSSGVSSRILTVGIKCVPYTIEDTTPFVKLLADMRGRSEIKSWFLKKWAAYQAKTPFTDMWAVRSQGIRGGKRQRFFSSGDPVEYDQTFDIIFAPKSDELADPKKLMKYMDTRTGRMWSTMTIFSNVDFDEMELKDTLSLYKELSKAGWGDLVVVNEAKESAHFCTTKMGACYEMPFVYMKNAMNLNNVLDYAEVSRWNKPFAVSSVKQALKENYMISPQAEDHAIIVKAVYDMNNIVNGIKKYGDEPEHNPTATALNAALTRFDGTCSKCSSSKVVRDMSGYIPKDEWEDPFDGRTRYSKPAIPTTES